MRGAKIAREAPPLAGLGVKSSLARASSHPSCAVSAAMASRPVTLGIDLGTTSVKAALLEAAPGHPSGFVVLASCARAARAETASVAAGPQVRQRWRRRPRTTLVAPREEAPPTVQPVRSPTAALSSGASQPVQLRLSR